MDRLQTFECVIAIVETGSFSSASKRLNIGQSAISKGVADLERQLETRLFIRSTRGVTVSEAGLKLYEYARTILSQIEHAMSDTRMNSLTLSGTLKVSAPVTLTRLYILPKLPQFLASNPRLNVELSVDDRNMDLVGHGFDVSLRVGKLSDSAFTATKLMTGKCYILATPDYIRRVGEPKHPKDLSQHQAVIYTPTNSGNQWTLQHGKEIHHIVINGQLTTNSSEIVRDYVLSGAGLTINSEWMFRYELSCGSVVRVLPQWNIKTLTLWAVYPTGSLVSGKVKSFVHFVKSCF